MPSVSYSPHGGPHGVAIVHCPNIFARRLAHLSRDGDSSWVLRDFVTGQLLRCAPPPNRSDSTHTLTQIEAEVTYSEAPPFHNVENVADWATYLKLRTSAVLGEPSSAPPNPQFGAWCPI